MENSWQLHLKMVILPDGFVFFVPRELRQWYRKQRPADGTRRITVRNVLHVILQHPPSFKIKGQQSNKKKNKLFIYSFHQQSLLHKGIIHSSLKEEIVNINTQTHQCLTYSSAQEPHDNVTFHKQFFNHLHFTEDDFQHVAFFPPLCRHT